MPSTVFSVVSKDYMESDERCAGPSIVHELDEASPLKLRPLPPSVLAHTPPTVHATGLMDQSNNTTARNPNPPPSETPLSSSCIASWELPAQGELTATAPVRTRIGGIFFIFETEGATRGSVAIARILDSGDLILAS